MYLGQIKAAGASVGNIGAREGNIGGCYGGAKASKLKSRRVFRNFTNSIYSIIPRPNPSQHPCISYFFFVFTEAHRVFAVSKIHMARRFVVALAAGVPFRDPIPVRGEKSTHNPFLPHRLFQLSNTSAELIFLSLMSAETCVLVVRVVQLWVPPVAADALGALVEILMRSFAIFSYWIVVAAVSRLRTMLMFFTNKARD